MAKSAVELGSSDPEAAETVARAYERLRGYLSECINEAQRAGELDPAADPRALASLVMAVVRGVEALARATVDGEVLLEAADQMISLLPRDTSAAGTHGRPLQLGRSMARVEMRRRPTLVGAMGSNPPSPNTSPSGRAPRRAEPAALACWSAAIDSAAV